MVEFPRIPRGNVRERRLAQFMAGMSRKPQKVVLEKCTVNPDTRPENPEVGRMVFVTDEKRVEVFNGMDWAGL